MCVCVCARAKKQEVFTLGEQVDLFKEAVSAKDHVVVELTNTVPISSDMSYVYCHSQCDVLRYTVSLLLLL